MIFFKRTLPLIIAFLMGITLIIQYEIPSQASENFLNKILDWDIVISLFAALLGLISLLSMHWRKIKRKVPGWGFSVLTWGCFLLTALVGFLLNIEEGTPFMWIFQFVMTPLAATQFALLAFYISSAAIRSFRARTAMATVLLVSAIFMMIGRVPLGDLISPKLPAFAEWILEFPSMAAQRGVMLGVALGSMATSLRIIFGIERGYLGGGD